jgi:hypothetical protein
VAVTDVDRLRSLLGEEIPAGGDASDTNFTEEKIDDLLAASGGDLQAATVAGWQIKAAIYSDMVDVAEGNSSRALSDLHKNALAMVKFYSDSSNLSVTSPSRHVVSAPISRR